MHGEINLETLLKTMQPKMHEGVYVFHTSGITFEEAARLGPVLIFREDEGTEMILEKSIADVQGLEYSYEARMITLCVHSSLEAVGFLAAITARLAKKGISVNPVSAHFHDHLFVPVDRGADAMRVLEEFSAP